ncbi:MAG: GNAT family N-acetyltransferase [Candidatus Latescibacteria bacterium]|nr:GNAT family N-acetyltransferase [Candidatus Latescibacterota bacterium]NIO56178.1 GNAT family N-acetyltransferase [Candidatus Latescibacterota bacterium]
MIRAAKKIRDRFLYGLVLLTFQDRFESIGINIRPYYWMMEGLGDIALPEFKDNPDDYSFEFFGAEEMRMLGATEERRGKEEEYNSWLKEGKKCFGVKRRGQIIAYTWIDFDEIRHFGNNYRLKDNEAYLFHMYTMKEYRGKDMAAYLRFECYRALREMGRSSFYSMSEVFNTPAIKFKRKLNANFVKLCVYIHLFKRFHWNWVIRKYKT